MTLIRFVTFRMRQPEMRVRVCATMGHPTTPTTPIKSTSGHYTPRNHHDGGAKRRVIGVASPTSAEPDGPTREGHAMRAQQLLITAAVAVAACIGYDMFKAKRQQG